MEISNIDSSDKKRSGYPRKVARTLLKDYFAKNPPFTLPIPIKEIAEFYRFEVYELASLNKHQRGIKVENTEEKRKLIGVNEIYSVTNKRFTIGHEMGHDFLGHPPESECSEEEIRIFNSEADEFSAEMLMPLDILKTKIKEIRDVKKIAKLFLVSEEALWIKIKNQHLLNLLS